jgi:hypothetical protein
MGRVFSRVAGLVEFGLAISCGTVFIYGGGAIHRTSEGFLVEEVGQGVLLVLGGSGFWGIGAGSRGAIFRLPRIRGCRVLFGSIHGLVEQEVDCYLLMLRCSGYHNNWEVMPDNVGIVGGSGVLLLGI